MTVFKPVDVRTAAQSQPMFVYNRIALTVPRVFVLYVVPYGFNYLLRRIVSRWNERGAATIDPSLNLEMFNAASSRPRQEDPIPFGMLSSPCGGDVQAIAEPLNPSGVTMTVSPRQSLRILNIAYPYGDSIRLEVTGQVAGAPAWVDVMLEGYLLPESLLAMWGGKGRNHG
jgi:hypothetical protein